MQSHVLDSGGEHVVARLRDAVPDEELAVSLHDLLGARPGYGPVVPGVTAQITRVQ